MSSLRTLATSLFYYLWLGRPYRGVQLGAAAARGRVPAHNKLRYYRRKYRGHQPVAAAFLSLALAYNKGVEILVLYGALDVGIPG
jgi:hypothetical protein